MIAIVIILCFFVQIAVREAKKNNRSYRVISLEQTGLLLQALKIDRFESLSTSIYDIVESPDGATDESDVELDSKIGKKMEPISIQLQISALKALAYLFSAVSKENQGNNA